ncbi:MAG: hypothetical protein JWR71_2400 [Pseudarthrobacter sp.]|nr:hypothetical protein [Pseudarthrobacter sp.]
MTVGPALLLAVRIRHRGGKEQTLGIGVLGVAFDNLSRPLLHDFSTVHHSHTVADVADDVKVVGDKQVGNAGVFLDLQEKIQDPRLGGQVQRTDRLVADDEPCPRR